MSKKRGRLVIDGKKGLTRETKQETKSRVDQLVKDLKNPAAAIKAGRMKVVHDVRTTRTEVEANLKTPEPIKFAFDRWRDEAVQLSVLATELGVRRSKLRRSFQQLAGGKDKFRELRAKGAGGTAEPFGGKRATGGRTKVVITNDDTKAIQLTRADAKDAGWKTSEWLRTALGSFPVLEGPDGTKYVAAKSTERADLVYDVGIVGIPPVRMKELNDSSLAKKAKQDEREAKRGEAALQRTRTKKRAAKLARKSGRTHAAE